MHLVAAARSRSLYGNGRKLSLIYAPKGNRAGGLESHEKLQRKSPHARIPTGRGKRHERK